MRSVLVFAYCGTDRGAASLLPAARLLRMSSASQLVLLWPEAVDATPVAGVVDARIPYPTHNLDGPDGRARGARAIASLRKANAEMAVIFTETGQAPHFAAYLCCLAGIPRRVALSTEFSGALLTKAVPAPADGVPEAERHLLLLEALGARRHPEVADASLAATAAAVSSPSTTVPWAL